MMNIIFTFPYVIGFGIIAILTIIGIILLILKKKKKVEESVDEVKFEDLQWLYAISRVDGRKAVLDKPRISNLICTDGRNLKFKWDVGLDCWNLAHTDPGAACAVFFLINNQWKGGMFEWISTSRNTRSLNNTLGYQNWAQCGVNLPYRGPLAFVIISKNGKLRSNVIVKK